MLITAKSALRRTIRSRLAALSVGERAAKSEAIASALLAREDVSRARTLALFLSLGDEPQTRGLIDALAASHRIVVPRVTGERMEFAHYVPGSLRRGAFGIEEPAGGEVVEPADIDAMVVPGVAFTADGARLGRGRGYYDRYLASEGFRAVCIGVCFAEQVVDELPTEPHDRAMDAVIFA